MAEALIAGIVKGKLAEPDFLLATDISPSRLDVLKDRYQIQVGARNLDAVLWADVIILCVKPQVMDEVLAEIQSGLSEKQLVISVAAGISIKGIQAIIGDTHTSGSCNAQYPSSHSRRCHSHIGLSGTFF